MIRHTLFLLLAIGMTFSRLFGILEEAVHSSHRISRPTSQYLPVTFYNHSQILDDSQIYILIQGINPKTRHDCYVRVDPSTGKGTCVDVTASTKSSTYSYSLSSFPSNSNGRLVLLPQIDSGRIFVSIAYPLDLLVDPNSNKIQDPDALNVKDSNYYLLYDKIEFTYIATGHPAVVFNPTAVDFFCLPLYLQLLTNSGVQSSGFNHNRADIFSTVKSLFAQYDQTPNKVWNKLIIPFIDATTKTEITPLRIASTNKAMTTAPVLFDPIYLSNSNVYGYSWIQDVWSNYYKSHTLSIDATELPPPNNQIFIGKVNDANQFVFTGASGSPTVTINLPSSSYPFFGAAGQTFDTQNNTPQAIIVRNLTSAFVTGLLPTASSNILNKHFFANNKANYYTINPLLSPLGQSTGPWYDLYSKALHSLNNDIYTFAYDDLLGTDGTLAANMSDSPSIGITLGDLTGTTIPDPFTDSTLYTITVQLPPNNPISYQGQLLKNNQVLTNVSIPFSVQLLGSDKQKHTANIYIKYPQVRPTYPGATGIIIKQTGPTSATIVFPAP
jgi:hypothetical protein